MEGAGAGGRTRNPYAERAGHAAEATWARMRLAMALDYGPTPVSEAIRRCHQVLEETSQNLVVRPASSSPSAGFTRCLAVSTRLDAFWDKADPSSRSSD